MTSCDLYNGCQTKVYTYVTKYLNSNNGILDKWGDNGVKLCYSFIDKYTVGTH